MINWFLHRKTLNTISGTIDPKDIHNSEKVLFALFTRYGDTVIDLVVIREFIQKYPNKDYLILCPKQMEPYVNELIPDICCVSLNKRNFFHMYRVIQMLKSWKPDIGFNPWSNGLDSCYFLTFCKHYHCYKDFQRPRIVNHYQVVRKYLGLPESKWEITQTKFNEEVIQNILICPQSTDTKRSISDSELNILIQDLKKFNPVKITIASMSVEYHRDEFESFLFKKNKLSSLGFLKLVKEANLVVSCDSGPLHIALALEKPVWAYFNSTRPEIVLNSRAKVKTINFKH